jgi:hypothetical protein
MAKRARIAALVLSHLLLGGLCLAAGLWAGLRFLGEDVSYVRDAAAEWTLLGRYGAYAEAQRLRGGQTQYRDALLDYIAIVEERSQSGQAVFSETTYQTDSMLVYTRLARLETQAGNAEAAADFKDRATDACESLNWPDCSWEALRTFSEGVEQAVDGRAGKAAR